jgi:hypothetical protein
LNSDTFSLLCRAIQMRVEIEFKVHGIAIGLRPHALYNDNRTGVLTLTGVTAVRILTHTPVSLIEDVALTARSFEPDPIFDGRERRYSNAYAIVERR